MSKFKVGDKVVLNDTAICIKAQIGKEVVEKFCEMPYVTIKFIDGDHFLLEESSIGYWWPERVFELYQEQPTQFKEGANVTIVSTKNSLKDVYGEKCLVVHVCNIRELYLIRSCATGYAYEVESSDIKLTEYPQQAVAKKLEQVYNNECKSPIKSDGSSSDYYKLTITRSSDGQQFQCELGDILYSVFGGDFNLGNIVKACRRMFLASKGGGKEGTDIQYDANKIKWFADDFVERNK